MSLLQMLDIRKSFYGVEVLHCDIFEVLEGEVHGLMGENGAGKSTLMKILMGEHLPDNGSILINDNHVRINNPAEALKFGIAKVSQELNPVRDMSISDNIFIGRETRSFGFIRQKKQDLLAMDLINKLGLDLNPKLMMRDLSIAQIQMVEIIKAVSFDPKILILDEPTSAITNTEIKKLFEIIRVLQTHGIGIIFITHKLDEVYDIANRVTVLRDGKRIVTENVENLPQEKLIVSMVGRKLVELFPKRDHKIGDVLLNVEELSIKNKLENINLELHRGEVLGLFGLMGSGRTELFMSLFGLLHPESGRIMINGREVNFKNPASAIKNKIGFITEDRKRLGLNLLGSVQHNLIEVIQKSISKLGIINKKRSKKVAEDTVAELKIKVQSIHQITSNLSGGNQQKVVVGKWQLLDPDILFFDEPTRGVDVGAKVEMYKIINALSKREKGIFIISSEMPEIIGLCDRVLVLCKGKIVGEISKPNITQELLMSLASG